MFKKIFTNFRKRWKLIIPLIGILIVIGIIVWRRQQPAEQLNFISPERGELTKTLEVSGAITAKQYAKLRFAAGGKVVYLGAQEGDAVKKWQTIATIDQRSLQKSLQKDLNDYLKERLDWDQTLDDVEDRWIAKSEERTVQQDQLDLDNTVIDVEVANIAITNTVLSAPFDGVLIHSPTNVTGVTLLSTETFDVINPQTLIFRATVDEVDIAQVQLGQPVTIELDAYPDEQLHSTVNYISYQSAESSTGTVFPIEIALNDQHDINTFRLGMNGDATITLQTKPDTLSIPIDATFEQDGQTFVTVKTGETTTEERQIGVGIEADDSIEVLSGLTEDDLIVLPE